MQGYHKEMYVYISQNIFPPEFEISQFLGQIKSPRRSELGFYVTQKL